MSFKGWKTNLIVLTINANDASELSLYGAEKTLSINDEKLKTFNAKAYADAIKQAAQKVDASIVIIDSSTNGSYLAPILAVNLEAGYASNVLALPLSVNPFKVKRKAFSSKAYNISEIPTPIKVVGLSKNSFGLVENSVESSNENFKNRKVNIKHNSKNKAKAEDD